MLTNVAKVATSTSWELSFAMILSSVLGYSRSISGVVVGVQRAFFQKRCFRSRTICVHRFFHGVRTKVQAGGGAATDNTAIMPVLPVPVGIRMRPVCDFAGSRRYFQAKAIASF